MKKTLYILVIAVFLLISCEERETASNSSQEQVSISISDVSSTDVPNNTSDIADVETDHKNTAEANHESNAFKYIVSKKADYIACLPKDMYRVANVVVKGKFESEVDTYVAEHSMPVTRALFTVEKVFKGMTDSKKIIVNYYGGTVSLSDYLATLSAEEITKLGFDSTTMDLNNATLVYAQTKESVVVNNEDTYVLFLSYDKEKDIYFILCDAYGACKMKNGKVYDLMNESYIEPDFLN